jgi:hypothetical protein
MEVIEMESPSKVSSMVQSIRDVIDSKYRQMDKLYEDIEFYERLLQIMEIRDGHVL